MLYTCTLMTKGTEIALNADCKGDRPRDAIACCEEQVRAYLQDVAPNRVTMTAWEQGSATIPDGFIKIVPKDQPSFVQAYDFSM